MANRIQLRRDTADNWTRVNPILDDGEPGLEIDTNKIKYGDGNTAWLDLLYAGEIDLKPKYKGFRAHYGCMYDNTGGSGPINKLVIYKSTVTPSSEIDTSSNSDDFQVTGLTGSDVVAMMVVVSDNVTQTPFSELKAFSEAIIDNVILTGGVAGNVRSVAGMKTAFYDNFNNFNTIIGNVDTVLEFYTSTSPDVWPTYYISDGGNDEYDGANAIHTNIADGILYNNGDVVSGSSAFGGGNYVVTYKDGIFGVFVTGANIDVIGTGGQDGYGQDNSSSGFDGDGVAVTGELTIGTGPYDTNRLVEGSYEVVLGEYGILTFPTGGHISPTKGGTMLDGGNGYNVSLTSFYESGMYSSCVTSYPNGGIDITSYHDGSGVAGLWSFNTDGNFILPTGGDIQYYGSTSSAIHDLIQHDVHSGNANYTLALSDRGKMIYQKGGYSVIVPTNAQVDFPVGTVITIVNSGGFGNLDITAYDNGANTAIYCSSTDSNSSSWGLPSNSIATILKVESSGNTAKWLLSGVGVVDNNG